MKLSCAKSLLLSATLLTGVCGCGGNATVSGKVTYQGRPVTHGSVIILSSNKTARSGVIEANGSYTVAGVHPGEVKIGVISRHPSTGREVHRAKPKPVEKDAALKALKSWFPLPRQLEDPETSGQGYTVTSGRNHVDINLK